MHYRFVGEVRCAEDESLASWQRLDKLFAIVQAEYAPSDTVPAWAEPYVGVRAERLVNGDVGHMTPSAAPTTRELIVDESTVFCEKGALVIVMLRESRADGFGAYTARSVLRLRRAVDGSVVGEETRTIVSAALYMIPLAGRQTFGYRWKPARQSLGVKSNRPLHADQARTQPSWSEATDLAIERRVSQIAPKPLR